MNFNQRIQRRNWRLIIFQFELFVIGSWSFSSSSDISFGFWAGAFVSLPFSILNKLNHFCKQLKCLKTVFFLCIIMFIIKTLNATLIHAKKRVTSILISNSNDNIFLFAFSLIFCCYSLTHLFIADKKKITCPNTQFQ